MSNETGRLARAGAALVLALVVAEGVACCSGLGRFSSGVGAGGEAGEAGRFMAEDRVCQGSVGGGGESWSGSGSFIMRGLMTAMALIPAPVLAPRGECERAIIVGGDAELNRVETSACTLAPPIPALIVCVPPTLDWRCCLSPTSCRR